MAPLPPRTTLFAPTPFHTVPRPRAAGIVFGGLDGVITTFSIVAAVAGAQLPIQTALLMGFSNLIADAISMGLGDFLSSKAEKEYMVSESKRELWEFEHAKELEVAEQEKLFTGKGMSAEDAKTVTATLAKYPALFHEVHLPAELGFAVPDDGDSPAMDGFVTFLSFIVFGSVPMWSYVITCASAKQPPRACARAQTSAMSYPSRARGHTYPLRAFFLSPQLPFLTPPPTPTPFCRLRGLSAQGGGVWHRLRLHRPHPFHAGRHASANHQARPCQDRPADDAKRRPRGGSGVPHWLGPGARHRQRRRGVSVVRRRIRRTLPWVALQPRKLPRSFL